MIHKIFAVLDSKAETYTHPLIFKTKGEAIRSFSDEANNGNSQISRHPEDYTLFEVGSYDDSNATFDLLPTPTPVGKALEFVSRGQAD